MKTKEELEKMLENAYEDYGHLGNEWVEPYRQAIQNNLESNEYAVRGAIDYCNKHIDFQYFQTRDDIMDIYAPYLSEGIQPSVTGLATLFYGANDASVPAKIRNEFKKVLSELKGAGVDFSDLHKQALKEFADKEFEYQDKGELESLVNELDLIDIEQKEKARTVDDQMNRQGSPEQERESEQQAQEQEKPAEFHSMKSKEELESMLNNAQEEYGHLGQDWVDNYKQAIQSNLDQPSPDVVRYSIGCCNNGTVDFESFQSRDDIMNTYAPYLSEGIQPSVGNLAAIFYGANDGSVPTKTRLEFKKVIQELKNAGVKFSGLYEQAQKEFNDKEIPYEDKGELESLVNELESMKPQMNKAEQQKTPEEIGDER